MLTDKSSPERHTSAGRDYQSIHIMNIEEEKRASSETKIRSIQKQNRNSNFKQIQKRDEKDTVLVNVLRQSLLSKHELIEEKNFILEEI